MPWWGWLLFAAMIVVSVVIKVRTFNQDYTSGSGMFKRSDDNLEHDKHLDISDYEYYNRKGKMK